MRYKILTLMAAAFTPVALAAQGQSQPASPDARIDAAMHAAAQAKIPTSLLASKVAEGKAKNVPQDRVATAVESRLKQLVRASSALDRANVDFESASELAVAADALEAGVTENALISLTKSAPEERRVVAVAVLADLVRLGQTSDGALAQVNAAVTTSAGLANLNAQVSSQLRLGGLTSTLDAVGILRIP
jgi:hypothetical protein